jgi:hypothetical protein
MHRTMTYLVFVGALLLGETSAADLPRRPGWPDAAPLTNRNIVVTLDGGAAVRVDVLGERLFRVRHSRTAQWTESGLNRYGVFAAAFPEVAFQQTDEDGVFVLTTRQARLAIHRKDGAIRPRLSEPGRLFEGRGAESSDERPLRSDLCVWAS